jgi:hypothetical protein
MRLINLILLFFGFTLSNHSFAHARWALDGVVKPRTDATGIKSGPCGAARTANRVTELVAGSKVQVKFESIIYHQGIFKIYFSPANDQSFTLLADNIKDFADQQFQTYTLTLPDQACEKCTLQLIQTMPDSGNSLYYSCADIRLTKPLIADTTAPAAVTNLTITENTQTIRLNWQNPIQDYAQTIVVQSLSPLSRYPESGVEYKKDSVLGNGTIVLMAAQSEFQSALLAPNTLYYFSVFALDTSHNYSQLSQVSGQLAQINHRPDVTLLVEQGGQITENLSTGNGTVTVQVKITDQDSGDKHQLDWSGTDPRLIDSNKTDSVFTFDPSALKAGTYPVRISVTDSGTPRSSVIAQIDLAIEETPKTLVTGGAIGQWEFILLIMLMGRCDPRTRR